MSNHVLVVEDEPAMRRLLRAVLSTQGYRISEAPNGSSALALTSDCKTIDLLLLDLGLPDMKGDHIIRTLRAAGQLVPIIVLSNISDENAKVEALDLGADDYVTKPFGARELLARVRAGLRHSFQAAGEKPVFRAGGLSVDLVRRVLSLDGQEIKLTPKEYALLDLLVTNSGKVLTHKFILEKLWSKESDAQYVRIYIRSLRQKLGDKPDCPEFIHTEQGIGYRFADPAEMLPQS
jgi:two-component system KDP operon response regulator KdpE